MIGHPRNWACFCEISGRASERHRKLNSSSIWTWRKRKTKGKKENKIGYRFTGREPNASLLNGLYFQKIDSQLICWEQTWRKTKDLAFWRRQELFKNCNFKRKILICLALHWHFKWLDENNYDCIEALRIFKKCEIDEIFTLHSHWQVCLPDFYRRK